MMTPAWRGMFPSLCTPFRSDGELDEDGVRAATRFALEAGVHGLVCLGLAGEVDALSAAERMRVVEAVVGVAGEVPVLAGATGGSLAESLELARHAEAAGAAGIVLPPPLRPGIDTAGIVSFFVEVAGSVSVPALLQDAPEYLGVEIGPAAVAEAIGRAPSIRGVKLETGPEGIEAWRAELGEDVLIFGGNGGMYLLDCLRAGADGVMPGGDTIDLLVSAYEAERAGRPEEAEEALFSLLPLLVYELQTIHHYNACAKHVLGRRGVALGGAVRPPARALDARSVGRLDRYLDRLRLVAVGRA
ncbi:MAG: dihydrodipicolinate synthase family protein [Thermoleophilia bacterium]|nr:dihydrodipicolinate synthase family protein [Thermoleophilia bacterium]